MFSCAKRRLSSAVWVLAALLTVLAWRSVGGDARDARCDAPTAVGGEAPVTRVSCGAGAGAGQGAPLRGPARLLFGERLDLNCEPPEALEVLGGIGPARAEAIRRARCESPFTSWNDVHRAHGVGPVTLAKLADVAEVVHPSARSGPCRPGCSPTDLEMR